MDIQERIREEFGDRVRIRWSSQEQNWQVEQKFSRGLYAGQLIKDNESDEMVRAREGYLQICAVYPGDRTRCQKCNSEFKVPINEFRMIKCNSCTRMGYDTRVVVGFFNLDSDSLIEHLRRLDPVKGGTNKIREQIAENNRKQYEAITSQPHKDAETYVKDMSLDIFGIAHTGYTGKESQWIDAPKSRLTNESLIQTP